MIGQMAKKRKLNHGTRDYAKPKSQVTLAATSWDTGPSTSAQNTLKIIEPVEQKDENTGKMVNPNGVKRARRLSVAEAYRKTGNLTARQASAADKLLKAWEKNHRSPPAIKEIQVDNSPKPDAHIAIKIDRISAYHAIAKLIPKKYSAFVMHVARDDRHITSMHGYRRVIYMERLREGLDALADNLERNSRMT